MHFFALLLLRLTYCNLLLNNRLLDNPFITFKPNVKKLRIVIYQCWTEGRSSTAVAKDLRPTATVAEVLGHSYGFIGSFLSFFSKMEAEMCFSLHKHHLRLNQINVDYPSKFRQDPF